MFRPLTRLQLVVDIVVAALFAAVVLWPELEAGRAVAFNALSTALVVFGMAAALAVRRLSPGLSLAIAWAAAIVQMAFGRPPNISDIAVFGVLFATAAYGSRRVFWAGLASVGVGAVVIVGYLFVPIVSGIGLDGGAIATAAAVLIAALFGLGLAWTIGALVRTGIRARENRRAQELAEAEAAAEAERTRIARDMHDVVAHSLAVVIAQADGARYAAASDPAAAADALSTISMTARAALSDVRMLLTQLRHTEAPGPQPSLADLEQLYGQVRAAGVQLEVDVDPTPRGDVPASVQLAVFRILQEALTNALRHGSGGPVQVGLAWHDDRVELSVSNGIDPAQPQPPAQPESPAQPDAPASTAAGPLPSVPRGHGLIGMRERAQLVGGALVAGSDGDGSFRVQASLPIGTAP